MERSAFRVEMGFQHQTAGLGSEGPMINAGRPHRVGVALEFLSALTLLVVADDQVARHKEDLFPIFVHERLRRVGAWRETQKPGAATAPRLLVEVAGDDLLLNARRITRQRLP